MKFIYSRNYGKRSLPTILLTDRFNYEIEVCGVDHVHVGFNDNGERFHAMRAKIPKGEGDHAIEYIERLLVERISKTDCVYLDDTVYFALARCEFEYEWKMEE